MKSDDIEDEDRDITFLSKLFLFVNECRTTIFLDSNWAKKAQLKQVYKISLCPFSTYGHGHTDPSFLCHITNCVSQITAQRSYQLWINSFQNSEIYLESWMRLLRKGEPHVYLSFSNLKLFRRTFVDKRIWLGSNDPTSTPISRKKAKESKTSVVVVNILKNGLIH